MIYITGPNETPPYTPMVVSNDSTELKLTDSTDLKAMVDELKLIPPEERMCLWQLQQSGIDAPTLLATHDIMFDAQQYAENVKEYLEHPLIRTPWISSEHLLTNESMFEIVPGLLGLGAGYLSRRKYIEPLDELFEALIKRDALNMQKANMMRLKSKHLPLLRLLEAEIEIQSKKIKELLPKRVDAAVTNYLHKKGLDVHKLRGNYYSAKMASKGKHATLHLEFLDKTNLDKLKKVIKGLIKLGKIVEHAALGLGIGMVVYDTAKAYRQKNDYLRAFFSGAAGLGAGYYLGGLGAVETVGACAISTLAGEAALGGLILASYPVIGTVVLIVLGAAVMGYVTYEASQIVEKAWDKGKDMWIHREEIKKSISQSIDNMYQKVNKAWNDNEKWIIQFYGTPYPYDWSVY